MRISIALDRMLKEKVRVELKDDETVIEGVFMVYDQNMNILLDNAKEFNNGTLRINYGRLLIRGSAVFTICMAENSRRKNA